MKKYHACIVCGRKIARAITLPAGKIYICTEKACREELEYKLTGAISVVGLDYETLNYHEAVCPEAIKHFKEDGVTLGELANDVGEYIWLGETLGEMFHEAIIEAGQKLEKNWIVQMKRTDLPLFLASDNPRVREWVSKQLNKPVKPVEPVIPGRIYAGSELYQS